MHNSPLIFLQLNLAWVLLVASFAAAQFMPGCQDYCGNISIPYPFGTSKECYIEENFLVTCNDIHYHPPKLFLTDSTIEIMDIYLSGQLRISSDVAHDCFGEGGVWEDYYDQWIRLANSPSQIPETSSRLLGATPMRLSQAPRDESMTRGACHYATTSPM
ncbi:hypothetical protein CsSME_00014795 [Camellia sinensis var. sinensis]